MKTKDEYDRLANNTKYSTDEQVVGKWVDGRPVYRKTVIVERTSYVSSDTINLGFPDYTIIELKRSEVYHSWNNGHGMAQSQWGSSDYFFSYYINVR